MTVAFERMKASEKGNWKNGMVDPPGGQTGGEYCRLPIANCRLKEEELHFLILQIGNRKSAIPRLAAHRPDITMFGLLCHRS